MMPTHAQQLQLFSLLLSTPQADSLELLQTLTAHHPWLQQPLRELQGISLQQWQGEHTTLFINGYPHTIAPPFVSALRQGTMGGGDEVAVADFYSRLGLEAEGMPADYLGTLFECAGWLLQQQQQPCDDFIELWDKYLHPVIPDFCRRLIQHNGLQLYQRMGEQLSQVSFDKLQHVLPA